jgi:hypothetical protein
MSSFPLPAICDLLQAQHGLLPEPLRHGDPSQIALGLAAQVCLAPA